MIIDDIWNNNQRSQRCMWSTATTRSSLDQLDYCEAITDNLNTSSNSVTWRRYINSCKILCHSPSKTTSFHKYHSCLINNNRMEFIYLVRYIKLLNKNEEICYYLVLRSAIVFFRCASFRSSTATTWALRSSACHRHITAMLRCTICDIYNTCNI